MKCIYSKCTHIAYAITLLKHSNMGLVHKYCSSFTWVTPTTFSNSIIFSVAKFSSIT